MLPKYLYTSISKLMFVHVCEYIQKYYQYSEQFLNKLSFCEIFQPRVTNLPIYLKEMESLSQRNTRMTTWVKLQDSMLSEVSQIRIGKYCMISFIWGIRKKE